MSTNEPSPPTAPDPQAAEHREPATDGTTLSWGRQLPRSLVGFLAAQAAPLELPLLGRTLLQAALVGAAAGLVGAAFFASLELSQRLILEGLAGYTPLRAEGERVLAESSGSTFHPWLLLVIPTVGALLGGLVSILAPETRGGGGDAMIHAFHHRGGAIRGRVIWVKALASIFTLGSGGSGGREGPTMQIGGALGSLIGKVLKVTVRERRILMISGVAAGIAAVFRTPLGAALLAIEVLYRDDFESEALVPAVLASVIAYSVVILIFGESTLFGSGASYPFVPAHLPLYGLMAVLVATLAMLFVATMRAVQQLSLRMPLPSWARPAVGGLLLGSLATPFILYMARFTDHAGQGLGLLGGGYGAAQMAISGVSWLPGGWTGIQILLLLCAAKLLASCFTIGTGGSAGDFAPSLVLGALLGGAFGRAAQLLLDDPSIDPGAFALVGMGAFYGGIAHVPLSSLVLVCELAGNYDLLVPLMLAEGIAFVMLRKRFLYNAQVRSRRSSPAHREPEFDVLAEIAVRSIMAPGRDIVSFSLRTPTREVKHRVTEAIGQDAFPVLDAAGVLRGMITSDAVRMVAVDPDADWTIAADIMQPAVREILVLGDDGRVVGMLDETEIAAVYLQSTRRPGPDTTLRMPALSGAWPRVTETGPGPGPGDDPSGVHRAPGRGSTQQG